MPETKKYLSEKTQVAIPLALLVVVVVVFGGWTYVVDQKATKNEVKHEEVQRNITDIKSMIQAIHGKLFKD